MPEGSLFDLSAYGPGNTAPDNEPEENDEPDLDAELADTPAPSLPMPGFDEVPHAEDVDEPEMIEPTPEPMPETVAAGSSTPARAMAASTPTALYRKYRPQTFSAEEHFGQEHVVNTLRNAIALDRIAHAYLFCGPRGTGKTSTARILAKAVNCEHPDPMQRPCNTCPSCIAISTGATTDVIEIDAASNRGIDDIRDLRERVKYAPTQLRTKFYIIDEAHQITGAAANAFLKTLEEPPAHTKFVLATTDPEDLLQTIVSRCQRFDFRRISLDAIVANLTMVAAAEHIEIDDDAKIMIARHATGSLRDAQGLLDQVAVYRENADAESTRVTADLVRTVLGVSRNDRVEQIATALADRDPGAGVRAIGEAVAAGDDVRQLARQLLLYMRELLLERSGGTSDLDSDGKLLAQRFDLAELADLARMFGEIDFKVKHATISQLPLEIAVIEGAIRGALPSITSLPVQPAAPMQDRPTAPITAAGSGNLVGRVKGDGRRPQPDASPRLQDRPAPAQAPAADRSQPPVEQTEPARPAPQPAARGGGEGIDAVRAGWGDVKARVHAANVRIGALLSEMDPRALEGDRLILTVPYTFHAQKMNSDETRVVVEQVLSRVMGKPMTLECFTTDEYQQRPTRQQSAARPAPAQIAPQPAPEPDVADSSAPDVALDDPMRAVRNIFDADEIGLDED